MKVFAKGGEYELTPEMVRGLIATYPLVNVRRELERMWLWTYKNPSKRWELPLRGIEAWLRREEKRIKEIRANKPLPPRVAGLEYGAGRTKPVVDAWWTTEAGIIRRGKELGLEPRRGETMTSFKGRVNESDRMSRATRAA